MISFGELHEFLCAKLGCLVCDVELCHAIQNLKAVGSIEEPIFQKYTTSIERVESE